MVFWCFVKNLRLFPSFNLSSHLHIHAQSLMSLREHYFYVSLDRHNTVLQENSCVMFNSCQQLVHTFIDNAPHFVAFVLLFWWVFSIVVFCTFLLSQVSPSHSLLSFWLVNKFHFNLIFILACVTFKVIGILQVSSSCFPPITGVTFLFSLLHVSHLCVSP